ncbi:hypothetical protein C5Y96_07440 [Blastopirellula marina]|uniref:Uncharacterized protein n=1 Tax=Blastopirellula marina TaxID=124 RepID=A0A2S8FXS4_9BACT|nr:MULTISPECIES: hypothetical protein [Pirellulaceae]PQO36986.1 hypothetical protein C5Y96_07440 [Blastopirellula marina]RCS53701.1 hypothetical protein DTL36_07450 [Bremerella cremea]
MATISTRDLSHLPEVSRLEKLLQSLAMLDAIVCPEWEYRYYSFNAKWGKGERMGSMRNGSGDDFFALFNAYGCFLKGFEHECKVASMPELCSQLYEGVPAQFKGGVTEPAFSPENVTFCLWRAKDASKWDHANVKLPKGNDPDGSAYLLSPLDGDPETYCDFAGEYYEMEVDPDLVTAIYEHRPLTKSMALELNADADWKDLKADAKEIAYTL